MKYLFFTFFCFTMSYAQYGLDKLGPNPITFIDSVKVSKPEILKVDSKSIALMSVYDPNEAKDLLGEDGKDGAIYVETIDFSKKRFLNYFRSKSEDFSKLFNTQGNDDGFQYILNGKILKDNFEGDLALIDDKIFKKIEIIKKEKLSEQYSITSKNYGIIITADVPGDERKE